MLVTLLPTVWAQRSAIAQSQHTRYGVDVWRETEGLPQSRIRDIVQTRDGSLWLATDDGVVRCNGAGFTSFTTEPGSPRDNEA